MNAFRHAVLRIALVVVVTVGLAFLVGDQVRAFEARTIAAALRALFGLDIEAVVGGAILVEQYQAAPVVARVTLSCSAIVGIVTFLAVSVIFMRGRPIDQRMRAFFFASAVWAAVNVVRIGGAVIAAEHWGPGAFEVFHNWVGTAMAVFGAVIAFMIMIGSYLPSSKELAGGGGRG